MNYNYKYELKPCGGKMNNEKTQTDIFVRNQLQKYKINFSEQGSANQEINRALKNASKTGRGIGKPEFIIVDNINNIIIIIEDKLENSKNIKLENDVLLLDKGPRSSVSEFAVNGAVHYANAILENSYFNKVIAIGVTGNQKKHIIQPVFVTDERIEVLPIIPNLHVFSEKQLKEYISYEIEKKERPENLLQKNLLNTAQEIHSDLRNYGKVKEEEKSLLISGILLALKNDEFSPSELKSKMIENTKSNKNKNFKTDGMRVFEYIELYLESASIGPNSKKKAVLSQFEFIRERENINKTNDKLGMSFIKHLSLIIEKKVFPYMTKNEDVLGIFYSEFISYTGGDSQGLGIVLTPNLVTSIFSNLLNLSSDDIILDTCTGTGSFLISAMNKLISVVKESENMTIEEKNDKIKEIKQHQLHGVELREDLFTIATTNMILRGDGKSNLLNSDYTLISKDVFESINASVGMINPPYSQNSGNNPELEEMQFIIDLLKSIKKGGRVAAIVPQSVAIGTSNKTRKALKEELLLSHTLEGVITLNDEVFHPVSAPPVIMIFTSGIPHDCNKRVKFINFKNDGFYKHKVLGRIPSESSNALIEELYDIWFDRIDATTELLVKEKISAKDEWIHSYFYYNEELPTLEDFEKKISDFLAFKSNQILQKTGLFEENNEI